MLIVGLAGGIATGKSLVAQEAAKLSGVAVIDADKIAWETYTKGTDVYHQLVARFGQGILTPEGAIDRKKLGALIFNDPQARDYLNSVVHPAVHQKLVEIVQEHRARGTKLLLIEAALLLESPYANRQFFDYVILVRASREAQIERLMKRNGLSHEEARTRVEAQTPPELLAPKADFVLDASGTVEETRERARMLFQELLARTE
ncbi:MAG: dephospho-CoA kinase [Candidatus Bipolaricaulota bacterium]|nr:dephospho-CoA kinase [Candidatus Bipolaricaulota bacterium]MCS7274843.1 dephospho-CoA kinase [Candidatus Bipolaricaulota bacterium]MDW8111264.1 dephospho-CoA kinase [Candidatus Bipolaricaulota bacterium]MDW8328600.1 dephospho-CoA kinase [Candidatus Bipolaricaulota bacterium]